ncbi:ATP-dependent DNA helicase, partial [bacterium]
MKVLCQFTAKAGDLDRRFTPAPTGRQGMEGHSIVASRRGAGYRTEVSLQLTHGSLTLRGRADGYLPEDRRVEECKTHRGPVDRIPENHRSLHRAQLQTYGSMLCEQEGLSDVTLALVYFDIDAQHESVVEERWTAERLRELLRSRCEAYTRWADVEAIHQQARDESLHALAFPFAGLHAEQRLLAEAVYRAASRGGRLLAEAPTGVGKTLGTLFPMLKALARHQIDKIFYLTAKSTGRALALDALAALRRADPRLRLRVLDLVAREKSCAYPGRECHGSSCPLARGFYDRLPAARTAAAELQVMDAQSLRAVADAHEVCAYYLGQEMIRWADVVVADYNHYFDATAMLHALSRESEWQVGVLVDEAHNLVPRAREMYSASLPQDVLAASVPAAPAALRGS